MSKVRTEKAEAIEHLRKLLKPGDTVYTVLRHVAGSGMSRRIDLYTIKANRPVFLTGWVGKALEYRHHKDGGLVVSGCGMDMGFHLVHSLGYALWGKAAGEDAGRAGVAIRKQLAEAAGRHLTQGGGQMPDPAKPDGCWTGAAGYALNHDWL